MAHKRTAKAGTSGNTLRITGLSERTRWVSDVCVQQSCAYIRV